MYAVVSRRQNETRLNTSHTDGTKSCPLLLVYSCVRQRFFAQPSVYSTKHSTTKHFERQQLIINSYSIQVSHRVTKKLSRCVLTDENNGEFDIIIMVVQFLTAVTLT